ncbi:hypothetical protein C440_01878 [Haloferax mucosum ATCC BAA-1512]|uniref:Lipoprotein n=1 Tax=Haloferax mucosum ATCC BAA-1512 TaxID=662479 RepID=M0IPK2_9EURY|nr:hypothetical protein [Haloferax mucosum]ELZ97957.1 hypothetical protein C440_01878 [Haloferax mucosum ATCC BAA-1512]
MDRRKFLGGVGTGIVLVSGCLGIGGGSTQPDDAQSDGSERDDEDSGRETAEQTPETATPEPTAEPTESEPTATPEPTPVSPEERIDFERDDDDPEVVGTLLLKGDIPGVIVSSDFQNAKSWQNYATADSEAGTYRIGMAVKTPYSIGRMRVEARMYDEEDDIVAEANDISSNLEAEDNALLHLQFEGDLEQMYYYEVDLIRPKS